MNTPYVFRQCTKCKQWLIASKNNFSKHKKSKWGLNSICKKCAKKRGKEYYEKNKEHWIDYKESNKEHIKKRKKEYREKNKENIKNYNKEYYENNKEYFKEYNKNHKEQHREIKKKYNASEKGQIANFNYYIKRKTSLINQGKGITKEQWKEMMDFFDWKCAYSNYYIGGADKRIRSIDHIVPVSQGGVHEIWNVVPMYNSYNCSKQDKSPLEWYKEQEYFSKERLAKIIEWQQYAYDKWATEEDDELILITDLK